MGERSTARHTVRTFLVLSERPKLFGVTRLRDKVTVLSPTGLVCLKRHVSVLRTLAGVRTQMRSHDATGAPGPAKRVGSLRPCYSDMTGSGQVWGTVTVPSALSASASASGTLSLFWRCSPQPLVLKRIRLNSSGPSSLQQLCFWPFHSCWLLWTRVQRDRLG